MSATASLDTCDREPIHIPGSIQNHGCLIVCDAQGVRVLHCSENVEAVLGLNVSPLESTLNAVLGDKASHDLRNALAQSSQPKRPGLLFGWTCSVSGRTFDVSLHRHDGLSLLEFEPASTTGADNPLVLARQIIARTRDIGSVKELCSKVPRYLQAMLGYDRVMLYQLAVDGSGKVVGEAKRGNLESFLGQHFPASDIPKQARALYLKNSVRVIADSRGGRSAVVPEFDASGTPVDLSYAHLRSVSPIHLEYLRNMGVGASMSLSIIVNGELWGLIACHHYQPRAISMAQRVAAEMFADFLSVHFTATEHQRRFDAALRTRRLLDKMTTEMAFDSTVGAFFRNQLVNLRQLIPSDGVGLWMEGIWSTDGACPPATAIPAIVRFLASHDSHDSHDIFATHVLSDRLVAANEYAPTAAGILAIPLSQLPRDYLFYFRKEQVQTLDWAGDPTKQYTSGPLGDRLTPRKSFAIWKELVERQSLPWTSDDREFAQAVQVGLREVLMRHSELLAAERRNVEVRQRILNEELNHRIKNILALIKSLVNQPASDGKTLEDYATALRGRIMALSFAHDQVIRSDGGGSLLELIKAELLPYPAVQVDLHGEDLALDARAYSVMALVLHEMATNAAKYGALSRPSGRLRLSWEHKTESGCEMEWKEEGGPPVSQPSRQGFGSVLLNRSIPFDLGGTSEIDYRAAGLVAKFFIPERFVIGTFAGPAVKAEADTPLPVAKVCLTDLPILIVEDQLVIALDVEDMLSRLGAKRVTTAATAPEALRSIAAAPPAVGILDVNLGDGTSVTVAEELEKAGIPYAFATGYGDTNMIPERLRNVPLIRKPYAIEAIKAALVQILAK